MANHFSIRISWISFVFLLLFVGYYVYVNNPINTTTASSTNTLNCEIEKPLMQPKLEWKEWTIEEAKEYLKTLDAFVTTSNGSPEKVKPVYVSKKESEKEVEYEEPEFLHTAENDVPSIEELQAVDVLERIPCTIAREAFIQRYEIPRTPVILTGCDANWSAKENWNMENLIPRFSNASQWRASLGDDFSLDIVTWKELVDAMQNKNPFYIFDNLDHSEAKELIQDYETPNPFQGGDLYGQLQNFPSPHYGSMRWFCMGSRFTGTLPHMDPCETDAWNTLLVGHKWWIIYPSEITMEDISMKCNDDSICSGDDGPLKWYTTEGRQAQEQNERVLYVLQEPGETIYVPQGRIHSVLNMDHTIAVTANFGSVGHFHQVWDQVLQVEDGKAMHWKTLYNVVFNKQQRQWVRDHYD